MIFGAGLLSPVLPRTAEPGSVPRPAVLHKLLVGSESSCSQVKKLSVTISSLRAKPFSVSQRISIIGMRGGAPAGVGEGAGVSSKRIQQDMMKL